jgi:guanylate kinase
MNDILGSLFVVSAPSGAGKSSLLGALRAHMTELRVAVSHTTRPPRPGEIEGEHYHFVDRDTFERMIAADEFLEHARVFDHYYGTSEAAVRGPLAAGYDLVLEIDWQGARQVRDRFPGTCSVFVLPPSVETLLERLTGRGQDDPDVIARRMQGAIAEMSHYEEYDYLVVNDDFDQALDQLRCVVSAQRLRQTVQAHRLDGLLRELVERR